MCDQLHGVHAAALAETIDPSDALLDTKRRPRQLEVHNQSAAVMKIQAFARRIRGE